MNYISYTSKSDDELARHIGLFVKNERLKQNLTQATCAQEAGISRSTLSLLERGESVTLSSLLQVLRVLGRLDVLSVFEVDERPSPMAMAKLAEQKRQRASGKRSGSSGTAEPPMYEW